MTGEHRVDRQAEQDEHPNVTTYNRMISAFNENRLDEVGKYVAGDLTYTVPGRSPIAGVTNDIQSHLQTLSLAKKLSGDTLKVEPRAVAADGDYLLIWSRISAQRPGKVLDSDHCTMYRFSAGRVVEGRTVPVDQYAFDAFWD